MSKLMKPLFIYGNFNREGKRIRANFVKNIGDYPIWISAGDPDNNYPKAENDKYIFIQKDEWLIPIEYTEHDLEFRAAEKLLYKEWYGNFEDRYNYINDNIYKKKISEDEKHNLVRQLVKKEEQFITEHLKDVALHIDYLQNYVINPAIAEYIDARDNNGKFPNFIGAAFLGELDKCDELSKMRHKRLEEEYRIRQEQVRQEKAKKAAEKEIEDNKLMKEAENIFMNGGKLTSGEIIVKLADKYGIEIPLRTKGWILNDLAEVTITEDGSISYRYWKRKKGSTGSQKAFDVLYMLCKYARVG